jgi:ribosomal subunit interface protein
VVNFFLIVGVGQLIEDVMDVPVEISFHNLESSDYLERRIRERIARLERFHDRITSCRVVLEAPHRSQEHTLAYHMRIELGVPQKTLIVSHDPGPQEAHFDAYVLIRDAFEAMERQLEDYAAQLRGQTKTHDAPLQGTVIRKFADYGFIATTDGREIYFHRNSVVDAAFEDLDSGEAVELVVMAGESPAGPQASTVRPIRPTQMQDSPRT